MLAELDDEKDSADKQDKLKFLKLDKEIIGLHEILSEKHLDKKDIDAFSDLTGIILEGHLVEQLGISRSENKATYGSPSLEVHNFKLANRTGPKDITVNQILVTLLQKRGVVARNENGDVKIEGFFCPRSPRDGWYKRTYDTHTGDYAFTREPYPAKQAGLSGDGSEEVLPPGWFVFRGGGTLIFDLNFESSRDNVQLKYIIKKDIRDEERMKRQYKLLFNDQDFSLNATYFGTAKGNLEAEPFAIIHKVM
jgi:hypothetical protein